MSMSTSMLQMVMEITKSAIDKSSSFSLITTGASPAKPVTDFMDAIAKKLIEIEKLV